MIEETKQYLYPDGPFPPVDTRPYELLVSKAGSILRFTIELATF
jgi:hypothetical protein